MFITFNDLTGFRLRDGESQHDAILRLIAAQLVTVTGKRVRKQLQRIICDEDALDEYIGDKPFVLLVDELNALASPLVFTSHIPLSVDFSACAKSSSVSARGACTVPFMPCLNIEALRDMSEKCGSLTPAEVMSYGGIPSLIYSVKVAGETTPEERFTQRTNRLS